MRFLHTLAFLLLSICVISAQTVWTGAVDTDWNNSGNWNAGVPTSGVLATISGGATNQPVYAGSTVLDFTIQNAGTLTFNTTVYNVGTIVNFGGATIVNDNQFINAGSITFDNDGTLNNNGSFDNYGVYDHAASAVLNNAPNATFTSYGSFNSNGQINNDGLINISGSFSNSNGMDNNGTFLIYGMASFPFGSNLNTGSGSVIEILAGGTLDMNGNLPNTATIFVEGMFAVQSAAVLTNSATIINNGEIDLGGQLINDGTVTNNSSLNISSSGVLENNSSVNNNSLITLEICGKLIQNAGNNIGGTIENEGLVYEINGTVDEVNGEFGETFTNINSTPAPIPACKGDVVLVLDENGIVNFTGEDIDQGRSYGSCGASLVSFDVTPNQFTTADIGVQVVTLTITDNFGVSSSCEDFVSVIPMPVPVVPVDDPDITFSCPNNISVDTEAGAQFAEVNWTEPVAETTCDPAGGGGGGAPDCSLLSNDISGFTYMGEYNNAKYYCSVNNQNWSEAMASVQAAGGTLAVVGSAGENQFLQDNMIAGTAWIGYTDAASEGNFVWVNGEPTTYTNWDAGEPNNYNNSDGSVILKNTGLWRDRELSDSYEVIMEIPCPLGGNCNNVDLTFVFDNYPEDISWEINDSNGTTVASGGNYGSHPGGATVVETVCLEDGCYDLVINDSYGDGLCCAYGNGSYALTDPNGAVLASGATFTYQETSNFCLALNGGGDPELTVTQISGPSNGSNFGAGTTEVAYEVTDACGNLEICTFEVTVNAIPATFSMTGCPSNIVLDAAPGANSAVATWTDPSGTSDCFRGGPIGVEQTFGLEKGEEFPVGVNNIGYAVFDSCGNFESCLFNVTINFVPATLTVANCSEDIEVTADAGSGGATVTWSAPTGSSDCYLGSAATVTQIAGPASGSFIATGVTQVVYLLTDDCVNTELCIFNITVSDPCANSGGDNDGDGVCADVDCDDNNAALPAAPGTTCDDGNANTENDVILADGCTCEGTVIDPCTNNGGDNDGDGVCADVDCDDNNAALPAAPGTTCDDGDASTENDVILADGCTCEGTVIDPCANNGGDNDGDGVCADVDCDDNNAALPAAPGTTCDDGDASTENDVILADGCTCEGTVIDPCANNGGDSDGDGVCADVDCDDNNAALPAAPGTTCDDGDATTENDVILADGCTCEGTVIDPCANNGGDNDGDGVCADVDCDDNNAALPAAPGTTCDDGDASTENDVILADGCTCEGTVIDPCANNGGDSDGDGVCADVDCDDNNAALPAAPGTTCDDGDASTENDVILADGCTCEGTVIDPCANNGGDNDGDGVCADVDCDDNNAALPAAPGTTCDDGDASTENDVILADGCSCAGTPIATGCNPMYSVSGNDVTITGLTGPHVAVNIYNSSWNGVFSCLDDCNNPELVNLPDGTYYIHIKIFTESWQIDCQVQEYFTIDGGGACTPGTPCNDGNACTDNDVYDDNCGCAGTYSGDADGDGVCANEDCDDNDASLPAPMGSTCDDNNADTENDVILADGCTCAGTPIGNGCNPAYSISGNDVTITGLEGDHVAVDIYNSSWANVFSCFDDCNNPELVNLPDGTYYIHIKILNASYQVECEIQEYLTISGGGGCTPGATCNDNDPCTDDDVYDDNCNCAGTYSGDADGDGICANEDCDDNDPALPAAPGTACDDGDIDTSNDEIQDDGCTCEGTFEGACAITVVTGPGDITINGLTGANVIVQVFDHTWASVFSCLNNCDNPQIISELPNGTYYVKATNYDAGWKVDCEIADYFTVSGGVGYENIGEPEFLFFNAIKNGREVSMNWTTNTEYKNAYFVVERSADGINFEALKDVPSWSDSHSPINYQDEDVLPFVGANFYRLKEVFANGEHRYSSVDVVVFEIDVNAFALYPNPTADQVFVNLKQFADKAATVQIYNSLGELMHEADIDSLTESPLGFDVSEYPSGMYSMAIKVEGRKLMTNLFVVTKL